MSNQDVIEVGSSDEETQPAPKRSKPMPNAMVCIPRKLHEVTIKPAKPKPVTLPKSFVRKGIIVQRALNTNQQTVNQNKVNGKSPVLGLKPKIAYNPYADKPKPVHIPGINKETNKFLKSPIHIKNINQINLPPSITIKRTVPGVLGKSIVKLNVKNKPKAVPRSKNTVTEMLTVDLDDDEVSQSSDSPQWYLRPEEQKEISAQEKENNKEPDVEKITEILIDDSPIKHKVKNKRTNEVGSELAIVIEDSPVKVVADKEKVVSSSENEDNNVKNKKPHSKKKLGYPKEAECNKTIEIEIDLSEVRTVDSNCKDGEIEIIETSLTEHKSNEKTEVAPIYSNVKPLNEDNTKTSICTDLNEFHPVYQNFIDLCFKLENSDDMKKIVEKKIKGYYRQVPKEYTESEGFTDMVSSKILSMKASPEKMYLYIKDIVDELNLQRKLAKSQPLVIEPKVKEPERIYGEESQYDSKRQRQIRKLEKTIKKLHRAIQKLEEQEVDFDDEDDSVYLLTERYKERMVRVYSKFCQLSNTKMPSEPHIQIDARPGQPIGPAKRLEKWINKKVPIGTPLPFPDFHDVLRCVREANDEDRLGLNEADIMEEARDLFVRCGRKLQRRRQENEWRLAASRITHELDPAQNDSELQKKLSENNKIAKEKEIQIFNKYADRQNQLKLEAEEIGDKEAEESPDESEEEEANDEKVSLETTEKRKEILKRILQEQSKKSCGEKTNLMENKKESKVIEKVIENNASLEKDTLTENKSIPETETISETETNTKTANVIIPSTETEIDKNAEIADQVLEKKDKEEGEIKDDSRQSKNLKNNSSNATETLTLTDDSNDLGSVTDELHLLEKLHSTNEGQSSTVDSSDSESPIAISDSLETSEDNKKEMNDDVISIENSSYSEDECEKAENMQLDEDGVQISSEENEAGLDSEMLSPIDDNAMDVEVDAQVVPAPVHTNNDEYIGPVEDVLLAPTEEENSQDEHVGGECYNMRDDLISIDETVIGNTEGLDILVDNNLNLDGVIKKSRVEECTDSNKVNNDDSPIFKSVETRSGLLEVTSQKNSDVVLVDDHSIESAEKSEQLNNTISESKELKYQESVPQLHKEPS